MNNKTPITILYDKQAPPPIVVENSLKMTIETRDLIAKKATFVNHSGGLVYSCSFIFIRIVCTQTNRLKTFFQLIYFMCFPKSPLYY